MVNHYELLGLKQDADKAAIKKAYHKQALKYHPDKNSETSAQDKFRSINEAYEVLIDDRKREVYDLNDFPQAQSTSSHTRQHHHHHQRKHNEQFFTGSSARCSHEKQYQNELDRIRRVNSDLLDKANAKLRKSQSSRTDKWKSSATSDIRNAFKGDILPEKNIDDYEKEVLSRLRASCR